MLELSIQITRRIAPPGLDLVRSLREDPPSAPPALDETDPYEVPTDPWL